MAPSAIGGKENNQVGCKHCKWRWEQNMWVLFKIVLFPILLLKPISLTFSWCNKRGKDCFNGAKMRLIKPRREFHYLQLFHFTSRKDILKVAFENLMINAKHLLFYMFQICQIHHFDSGDVPLNSFFFTTNSVCSYHDWSIFMEWA